MGYLNKTASDGAQFYYLTAPTRNIGDEAAALDIQKFQMNSATASKTTNIQLLDGEAFSTAEYTWLKASLAEELGLPVPAGAVGVWAENYDPDDESKATLAVKTFLPGEAFQLYTKSGKIMTFSGQISDADVTKTASDGAQNYYIGNPFAADLSIQNIQMNSATASKTTNIQVLDGEAFSVEEYTWLKASLAEELGLAVPAGSIGIWAENYDPDDESKAIVSTRVFTPGEGFQLYTKSGKIATIYAPYDL